MTCTTMFFMIVLALALGLVIMLEIASRDPLVEPFQVLRGKGLR